MMYRQSPSRNQRSKRFKVKRVLQMCLLFCVSIWLIYQVMHSHAKKKEYGENDAKISNYRPTGDSLIKLGRKGIQVEETTSKNEAMMDEETSEEEEENKNEEDDMDEHDREKSGAEFVKEDEFIDNEERDDGDEKENGEEDSEDDERRVEKEGSKGENHLDGEDWSMREAREEHYRADDASSAVTHDFENENAEMVNRDQRLGSILEKENEKNEKEIVQVENRNDLEWEVGERIKDGDSEFDITSKEILSDASTNSSFSNNIVVTDESTDVILENHDSSLQNVTEILVNVGKTDMSDSDHANNFSIAMEINNTVLESNSEISSLSNNKSYETSNITLFEASVETGNKTESSAETDDSTNVEFTAIGDSKDDGLDSKGTEDFEEVQHDPIDVSDSFDEQEEKGVEKDHIHLDLES